MKWIVVASALAVASFAAACGGDSGISGSAPRGGEMGASPATDPPLVATVTPTASVPPTPAKAVAAFACQVLPDAYCAQGDLIRLTNVQGRVITLVGFKIPAGIGLISPMKGQSPKVALTQPNQFNGVAALVLDPNDLAALQFTFIGDLEFPTGINTMNVERGSIIGHTKGTEHVNLDGYNLLIVIGDGTGSTEEPLRKFFGPLFDAHDSTPLRLFPYTGPANPTSSIGSPIYSDTPFAH